MSRSPGSLGLLLASVATLALLNGALMAQETTDPAKHQGGFFELLGRITLFADRIGTAVLDVPANITVVTGAELDSHDPTIPLQGLSMGERQRLALARVLILKPSWVVLDEATSALDASAEANLLGLIRSALPHSTILCVAHRAPQALAPFDVLNLGMQPESERENRLT